MMVIVAKAGAVAVEEVQKDEKEGRWMAVLLVLGGTTKCWLHGGYGVSGGGQRKNSSHALGVIDYWVKEINSRVIL